MATRDLLPVIRAARAGDAAAQLTLGRHYLFGGNGLPRNPMSALHWLDRAARRDVADAWRLIGEHIPYETVRNIASASAVLPWYDKAFDAGVVEAGLTLARLVMDDPALRSAWHDKAMRGLHAAAQANMPDAQWLLAQHAGAKELAVDPAARGARKVSASPLEWAASAADAGILAARYALAERAWAVADYSAFLRWSLPLARELMQRSS
ncbi:hypothetical protein [Noviherbaspirillum sp. ST9]|uniref:hypothetical protein n=1 Tax=Noviherbaspirillum sp. ST9 TaxID=3401606 RepID=UPI003B5897C0